MNIRDRIIEGILDADTTEDLLQQTDLTLAKAISKCQAQEAAKKQCAQLHNHGAELVAALHKPQSRAHQNLTAIPTCQGCGAPAHPAGQSQCPAYHQTCFNCQKVGHFAKVCQSKPPRQSGPSVTTTYSKISNICHTASSDTAPLVTVNVTSTKGSSDIQVLPDLVLTSQHLEERYSLTLMNSLSPSDVTPKAVNGTKMYPIGKLPVTLCLGSSLYLDNIHIYPNVHGTLLSWKACKALQILPPCYPNPISTPSVHEVTLSSPTSTTPLTVDHIISEYPTVFDGQIRSMQGEQFHISLMDDTKPFCVNTPWSIPFAYCDKLQTELGILERQQIIAPVTTPTEWCATIIVTPKTNTDRIRMCVDLSHLSRYVCRERYQSSTPVQAVADIAATNAKIFTVLDALKGYHQCPLDQESQIFTTFITIWQI